MYNRGSSTAVEVLAMRWTPANHDAYMALVRGCSVADHLGLEKLYSQISVAVEKGDYAKLRFFHSIGIDLAYPLTVLNEYGFSNVNFALATANMPLLVFMAENGAELRYACLGPATNGSDATWGPQRFTTPLEVAEAAGWAPWVGLITALIRQQQVTRDLGRPLAIGDRGYDVLRMAFLPEKTPGVPEPAIITVVKEDDGTMRRAHEDGSSTDLPAPPWSGAPLADDNRSAEEKAKGADPLVKELLRCREADAAIAESLTFDEVLAEEKRAVKSFR